MPRRSVILLLALLPACVAGSESTPPLAQPSISTSTSTTSPVTTRPSVPSTTTTERIGPPVAWLTTTGIPVAVTDLHGDLVEVLTPCGHSATMAAGTPIYQVDVVVDPGHGGPIDTGAVAPTGLEEKQVNLEVAQALVEDLEEREIAAVLTRAGDYALPIRVRSDFVDMTGAAAVVSIHHNAPAAPASDIPGVEIFVQQASAESQRLGGLLYESVMAALRRFDVDWDRSPDAGVMTVVNTEGRDAYGMVRRPQAPSALVELGYIANRAEAELYADAEYAPSVAEAMGEAIEAFLESDTEGAPLVEGRVFDPRRGVGQDQCVDPDLGEMIDG